MILCKYKPEPVGGITGLAVTVETNKHERPFLYRDEVPARVLADQFDHLPDEFDGFLKYRGCYYHVSDFTHISSADLFPGDWDGYLSDSFFSGITIKLSRDCETYVIGTFYTH